jgi:periplasmic protein TonB
MNMQEPWLDETLAPDTRKRGHWVVRVALAAGLLGFIAIVAFAALALMSDSKPAKRQIVQISLLRPPPPAPPPPPPEQKPPEPQVKEEVKLEQPEPDPAQPDAPPPGEQLGLDANGSGEGDGFGLAAKKGGRDITTIGGEGGSNHGQFAGFAGMVQAHLQEQFQKNNKLRSANYRVVLRVWFGHDGRIERYELTDSTGNPEIDKNLRLALDGMPRLRQPPPESMPQPLKLRLTSRGAG